MQRFATRASSLLRPATRIGARAMASAPASHAMRMAVPQVARPVERNAELMQVLEQKMPAAARGAQIELASAKAKETGMVFEIGLTFVVSHYVHIFIALARNLFQTFRPLLILFGFGQIIKAAFFAMGAPMLISFYSIWMFEVFYGLMQCIISFIFVAFFYNNLSMRRNFTMANARRR